MKTQLVVAGARAILENYLDFYEITGVSVPERGSSDFLQTFSLPFGFASAHRPKEEARAYWALLTLNREEAISCANMILNLHERRADVFGYVRPESVSSEGYYGLMRHLTQVHKNDRRAEDGEESDDFSIGDGESSVVEGLSRSGSIRARKL